MEKSRWLCRCCWTLQTLPCTRLEAREAAAEDWVEAMEGELAGCNWGLTELERDDSTARRDVPNVRRTVAECGKELKMMCENGLSLFKEGDHHLLT